MGELFLFGLEPDNYEFLQKLAHEAGLGGVVIFERNCLGLPRLQLELARLRESAGGDLIVAVDQEGGPVNRLAGIVPTFPSMSSYGRQHDLDGVRVYARTTAEHLLKLGINTNFAPVCDVLTHSGNSFMSQRSFGSDPEIVAMFASAVIEEHHRIGVAACAKHFPGLGGAAIDPHQRVAICDDPQETFEVVHWRPFRAAMANGVELVMTTHLLARALDAEQMATYSSAVVQGSLRSELGFQGVVVTDDLGMGAVTSERTPGERAVQALKAGHDLVMFCHQPQDQEAAYREVVKAADSGRLPTTELELKLARIQSLKQRLRR